MLPHGVQLLKDNSDEDDKCNFFWHGGYMNLGILVTFLVKKMPVIIIPVFPLTFFLQVIPGSVTVNWSVREKVVHILVNG